MRTASNGNARTDSAPQLAARKLDYVLRSSPRLITARSLSELVNTAALLAMESVDAEAAKVVVESHAAQARSPDAKAGLLPPGDHVHQDGTRTKGALIERVCGVFRRDGTRIGTMMAVSAAAKQLEGIRDALLIQIAQLCGVVAENLLLAERHSRDKALLADVISVVSRDFRPPLQNMALALGLLDGCEPRVRESLAFSVAQLAGIVDDVLDTSRLQGGSLELQRARHPLAPIVERVMRGFAPQAKTRGVDLRIEYKHEPVIICDAHRLAQAFASMLHTALHATASGGKVLLRVHAEGATSVVEVIDGGPGIDAAERERLFERDSTSERRDARSRLGLFVARAIIQAHGGTIGCDPVPDRGTKLWVRLK